MSCLNICVVRSLVLKPISNMCNTVIKDHKATNVSSPRLARALRISRSVSGACVTSCVARPVKEVDEENYEASRGHCALKAL